MINTSPPEPTQAAATTAVLPSPGGRGAGGEARASARSRQLVVLLSLLVMALTCVPYLWAIANAKPAQHFAGFIWGVDDGNVYLCWIRQASEGRLFLRDQYTTDPQNPHFLNVFLLALGGICRLTGLAPIWAFHGARVICGAFCLTGIFALARHVLADRRLAWLAWGFAAFSSGFGWIVVAMLNPQDRSSAPLAHTVDFALRWQAQPEAITFLSLLLNPLFCLAMGLMCFTFVYSLRALATKRWGHTLLAGALLLILGNAHSYDVFVVYGAMSLWLVWALLTRQTTAIGILHLAVIFAISAPAVAWAWYTQHADPSYLAKTLTPTKSAQPFDYAMSYGLVLLLAALGGLISLRAPRWRLLWGFPAVWVAMNAGLIYAPVSFQRKMAEGLHIPLCLLAALGLGALLWGNSIATDRAVGPFPPSPKGRGGRGVRRAGRRMMQAVEPFSPSPPVERGPGGEVLYSPSPEGRDGRGAKRPRPPYETAIIAALVVMLTIPSNFMFISDCLGHVAQNNLDLLNVLVPPAYLTADDAAAMRWLGANTRESDVVLSSSLTGNHIPAHAPCLVYAGHWAETLHYGDTLKAVSMFYVPGQTAAIRRQVLAITRATYVYLGPCERMLQQGVAEVYADVSQGKTADDLATSSDLLQPVFRSGQVTIFRVMPARREAPGALTR